MSRKCMGHSAKTKSVEDIIVVNFVESEQAEMLENI